MPTRGPIRGRGTSVNPPNRFERLSYEDDPEAIDPEAPPPQTEYLRDATKSIIARNVSPDVGFETSVNPYRGCSHGCTYCIKADTPVLHSDMRWRPLGEIRVGDDLVGFDEFPRAGGKRKLRKTVVRAVWWSRKPTLRVRTRDSEVLATENHRWLQSREFRWSCTHELSPGRQLRRLPVSRDEEVDEDYRAGYIAGLTLADGTFRFEPDWESFRPVPPRWRMLVDDDVFRRLVDYLRSFGVGARTEPSSPAPVAGKPLNEVRVESASGLSVIRSLVTTKRNTRNYYRGFVAGFFDTHGYNGRSLRISRADVSILERVRRYAHALGFTFVLEPRPARASAIRLAGGLVDRVRFVSVCRPAIRRKIDGMFDQEMSLDPEPIEAIERGPITDVVDIETSTGTFIAAGLATHNCFARPTHELLGFSAGLDFETKILVKEDAPELLRRELASPKWTPQPIALSGVTDPYQPVERRLGLTRRCLEVLAECRNPLIIITKNHLVTRDADLLAELARHDAVLVFVSVTTLDPALVRILEPRTSTPAKRLAAIETLSAAGVPVGVLVAPVIPAITDHEMPAILSAVASAGATVAGYVMLRLPYAVKELFERWLEDHFPGRKDKVLSRIRGIREGKLNDPRFGSRLRGSGAYAEEIENLFAISCRRAGISGDRPALSTAAFRRPRGPQQSLF